MTPAYRLLGVHERQIGNQLGDGELVHQSAIDRLNGQLGYASRNLSSYLCRGSAIATCTTSRIARGSPC